ncbi:hypothetical protein OVA03_12710 [Asticcacaulis sp. SL142]|uniref:hypothetical protein n=1 Tax=Asticcacaulis sp. SL142 TaxID=2995155 RepID=UPI00226CF48D|nr:hypothetical protein [Asticcacaulis sp. SL142]WAC47557.1 hypothetical protein OVA03_12710 [Asticcacaulis sp. SL142]
MPPHEDKHDGINLPVTCKVNTPAALDGAGALTATFQGVNTMTLDVSLYMPLLDGYDMSESEKTELLTIVDDIMRQFVELAFDVHPTQLAIEAFEKKYPHEDICHETLEPVRSLEITSKKTKRYERKTRTEHEPERNI